MRFASKIKNLVNYVLLKNIWKHIGLLWNVQRLDTVVLCAGFLHIHNNATVVGPILFDSMAWSHSSLRELAYSWTGTIYNNTIQYKSQLRGYPHIPPWYGHTGFKLIFVVIPYRTKEGDWWDERSCGMCVWVWQWYSLTSVPE